MALVGDIAIGTAFPSPCAPGTSHEIRCDFRNGADNRLRNTLHRNFRFPALERKMASVGDIAIGTAFPSPCAPEYQSGEFGPVAGFLTTRQLGAR
jgi:hypothetical protein